MIYLEVINMLCSVCGKSFEAGHGNIKFCSDECRGERKREVKRAYRKTPAGKAEKARYRKSPGGKKNKARYFASEKGISVLKEAGKKWRKGERGKQKIKASNKNKIESRELSDPEYKKRRVHLSRLKTDPGYRCDAVAERNIKRNAGARKRNKERMYDPIEREKIRAIARNFSKTPSGRAGKRNSRLKRKLAKDCCAGVSGAEWLEIVEKASGVCLGCGSTTAELHMDHIIPLSKGGKHEAGNIQPLCKSCNSSKGARLDWISPLEKNKT